MTSRSAVSRRLSGPSPSDGFKLVQNACPLGRVSLRPFAGYRQSALNIGNPAGCCKGAWRAPLPAGLSRGRPSHPATYTEESLRMNRANSDYWLMKIPSRSNMAGTILVAGRPKQRGTGCAIISGRATIRPRWRWGSEAFLSTTRASGLEIVGIWHHQCRRQSTDPNRRDGQIGSSEGQSPSNKLAVCPPCRRSGPKNIKRDGILIRQSGLFVSAG